MAVVTTHSLQYLMESRTAEHDLETHTLQMILMDDTFTFDSSTHATYTDVSANELATGNGYTAGGQTITNVAVSIDATAGEVVVDADNVTWTASGGTIATTGSAIVYNDSHANDTVILCIDFGADYQTPDGQLFQVNVADGLSTSDNV